MLAIFMVSFTNCLDIAGGKDKTKAAFHQMEFSARKDNFFCLIGL